MKTLVSLVLFSYIAFGQSRSIPTSATVQIHLDSAQAKYSGNEHVKPCGQENKDGACVDYSLPHYTAEPVTQQVPHCEKGWRLERWHEVPSLTFNDNNNLYIDDRASGYYPIEERLKSANPHPDICVKCDDEGCTATTIRGVGLSEKHTNVWTSGDNWMPACVPTGKSLTKCRALSADIYKTLSQITLPKGYEIVQDEFDHFAVMSSVKVSKKLNRYF